MSDSPRGGRPPFNSFGERPRGKNPNGGKRPEGGAPPAGNPPRFTNNRQGPRPGVNGNTRIIEKPVLHYQVVMMDPEEYGDALEQRLNALGHEGWRLVAIDDGRQYVFIQG